MPQKSNFHSVWGIGGPDRGYLQVIVVATAVGLVAGAITASALLEGPRAPLQPHSAVPLRFTNTPLASAPAANVTPSGHPENSVPPQSAAHPSQPTPSAPPETPANTDNAGPPEPQTASTAAATPQQQPLPRCDVALCEQRYQSFRPSDCTYQPYAGPRRFCSR